MLVNLPEGTYQVVTPGSVLDLFFWVAAVFASF